MQRLLLPLVLLLGILVLVVVMDNTGKAPEQEGTSKEVSQEPVAHETVSELPAPEAEKMPDLVRTTLTTENVDREGHGKESSIFGTLTLNGTSAAANMAFGLRMDIEDQGWKDHAEATIHTNAQGEFAVILVNTYALGSVRTITLTAPETGQLSAIPVTTDLSFVIPKEGFDLGALDFTPPPRVVSGVVVDWNGQPLADCRVFLEELPADSIYFRDPQWKRAAIPEMFSDQDGVFTIRGKVSDGTRLRVCAEPEDGVGEKLECRLGDRGVKLVVQKGWKVYGHILVDAGIDLGDFSVHLAKDSPGFSRQPYLLGFDVEDDGSFKTSLLPPGNYSLELHVAVESPVAVMTWEVHLGPHGGKNWLDELDLRGRFNTFTVSVSKAGGRSPRLYWASTMSGEQLAFGYSDPLQFISLQNTMDIQVDGVNCQTVVLRNIKSEEEVVLPTGIPLRIVIQNDVELREGVFCVFTLEKEGGVPSDTPWINETVMAWDLEDIRTYAPGPGLYSVNVSVLDLGALGDSAGGGMAVSALVRAPQDAMRIEISDSQEVQEIPFTFSSFDYQRIQSLVGTPENNK